MAQPIEAFQLKCCRRVAGQEQEPCWVYSSSIRTPVLEERDWDATARIPDWEH